MVEGEWIFRELCTAGQAVEETFLDNRHHHPLRHLVAKTSYGQMEGLDHRLYIHQLLADFSRSVGNRLFLLLDEVALMAQRRKILMPVAVPVVLEAADDDTNYMVV